VRDGGERAIVARNERGYVKGLCIYSVRDHFPYGRLLDIPVLIVASAADPQGVAAEFADYFRLECSRSRCSGIRLWTMLPNGLARRSTEEDFNRRDEGIFVSALTSGAQMENAVRACATGEFRSTGRPSR
jgi:hypothetical protein